MKRSELKTIDQIMEGEPHEKKTDRVTMWVPVFEDDPIYPDMFEFVKKIISEEAKWDDFDAKFPGYTLKTYTQSNGKLEKVEAFYMKGVGFRYIIPIGKGHEDMSECFALSEVDGFIIDENAMNTPLSACSNYKQLGIALTISEMRAYVASAMKGLLKEETQSYRKALRDAKTDHEYKRKIFSNIMKACEGE
jgi:hypothetical protein